MKKVLFSIPLLLAVVALINLGCDVQSTTNSSPASEHALAHFTAENFESLVLNSDKPVLVDFWATWCGPCVALTPTIEELAHDFDGKWVVGKVNVDEQQKLAAEYGIDSIPAILYFKDGEVVKQTVGKESKEFYQREMNEILGM
jgi:thioredoxin 1